MRTTMLAVGLLSLACAVCVGCKGSGSSAVNLSSVQTDPKTGQVTGTSNINLNVDKNKLTNLGITDTSSQGAVNVQYNRSPATTETTTAPARPQ